MPLPPKKKDPTHKHMRCVICETSFAASYDPATKKFRPYHLVPPKDDMEPCEDYAFEQLLRILMYLHSLQNSVTITHLVFEYKWEEYIGKKKDFLQWCLEAGYLTIDNFKRIEIPGRVAEEGEDLFETTNLDQEENIKRAVAMLKHLLQQMAEEGGLEPVPENEIPIQQGELDQGPSKLYKNIDTNNVELKSDKGGMVTAGTTGAREVNKRMSTASGTMERKRLEQKK
jgi:hypothetical protein